MPQPTSAPSVAVLFVTFGFGITSARSRLCTGISQPLRRARGGQNLANRHTVP